jgi:Zn-finger nucleic acid-binding protein
MNRNNFARVSGVIIDICKQHGIWFDAEELPKIIEFVRKGGLSRAREKEKLQLKDDMRRLRDEQRKISLENSTFDQMDTPLNNPSTVAIREFVRFLFD